MRRFLCAFLFLALPALPAVADPPAQTLSIDATTTAVSPSSLYGPWNFLDASFRTTLGNDKPGITVVTRSDRDAADPTSGTEYVLDDYHQFSQRAYGYASLQAASGTIFATRGAYLEGDAAVAKGVAFGAGGGVLVNPNQTVQRYASIGPTVYLPHGNVTLRYLPVWTQGDVGASSWLLSTTLGDEGRSSTTISLQNGVVPSLPSNLVLLVPGSEQSAFAASVTTRHFFTPHTAYDLGIGYSTVSDRETSTPLYHSLGLTVGITFGRQATPAP